MFDIFLGVKGVDQVTRNLKAASEVLYIEEEKRMYEATDYLTRYIREKKLSGYPLHRRSGKLARSIRKQVKRLGSDVYGYVGTKMYYALVQEEGRVIRAKKKKFLAIPLAGAYENKTVLGRAKDWKDSGMTTFVAKSKAGNLIIFGQPVNKRIAEEAGSVVPLFLLRTQVNIPPRPFMRPAAEECREHIFETLGHTVEVAVATGNGARA